MRRSAERKNNANRNQQIAYIERERERQREIGRENRALRKQMTNKIVQNEHRMLCLPYNNNNGTTLTRKIAPVNVLSYPGPHSHRSFSLLLTSFIPHNV